MMLAPLLLALAWQAGPALPLARSEVAGAAYAGGVAVVGGYLADGRSSGRVDLYRPGRGWSRLPSLPVEVNHASAVTSRDRLYVVGGRTAGYDTNLDVAEAWTPGRGGWRRLPPLPSTRGGSGLAAAAGMIVSVGGEEPAGTIASVYALRPHDAAWSRLPDLPTPRHGLAVVALGRTVYAVAGGPQPGLRVSDANERLTLP